MATLHQGGALVLGYLYAGTIEPYRPWFRRAKPYRLDYWKQWGEWYANVDAPGFRKLILGVATGFERKGLDGLFLDNTDMIETHPKQAPGMRPSSRRSRSSSTAATVSSSPRTAPTSTVPSSVTSTAGTARTSAPTEARCADLRAMHARGLLTLATGYVKDASSPAVARDIRLACETGALPFVSNLELTRIPQPPPHC